MFANGDETSAFTRRFRDLCVLHADDLGSPESLSEAQLSLVRRVAALEVALEGMEADMSRGEAVDIDSYARVTGTLARTIKTLGLKRQARDITPMTIAEHMAAKRAAQAAQ